MDWSACQYQQFEAERNRPVRDLLSALPDTTVHRAADIGCGPGNSTELLGQYFPHATIVGLDSSPAMIDAARLRLPHLDFAVGDIADWNDPGPFDLILANAALQWVPDHAAVLPRLLGKLAPGGSLAVQIPDNWDEPAHRLMRELSADPRWAPKLAGVADMHANRHDAVWYFSLLRPRVRRIDIWRSTYFHELEGGSASIVEWFKGSALRPLLARLDDVEKAEFLGAYHAAIDRAYSRTHGGTALLPFPRLFFIASS